MSAPDSTWPDLAKYSPCAHITGEAITRALDGFSLKTDKDANWIAVACRIAFCIVGGNADDYPGSRAIREELVSLRNSLTDIVLRLSGRSDFAESALRRFAVLSDTPPIDVDGDPVALLDESWKDWRVEGSKYLRFRSSKWREFDDAIKAIADAERYVAGAIDMHCTIINPPRWRDAAHRKDRINFAIYLSAIFEAAYARPATINNWLNGEGKARLGPWPDFFSRVACLALKLPKIPDAPGVLKAARTEYSTGGRVILPQAFLDQLHT